MAHVRKLIRSEFETIILAGVPEFGSRVTSQRVLPIIKADLPMCTIEVKNEQVQVTTLGWPRVTQRDMRVEVKVYCAAGSNAQDTLDALCVKLEQALFASEAVATLNGKAKMVSLAGVAILTEATGDLSWALATHALDVNVLTLDNNPEVEL